MKKCPQCAEEIQDEAVKCRHCGSVVISSTALGLAERWGALTQAEREKKWAAMSAGEQHELQAAIDNAPRPSRVNDALGTLIAVVGVLLIIASMLSSGGVIVLVLGAAILGLGLAVRRKPQVKPQ